MDQGKGEASKMKAGGVSGGEGEQKCARGQWELLERFAW